MRQIASQVGFYLGHLARLSRFLSTKAIFAGEVSLSELQPAKFSRIPGPVALGRKRGQTDDFDEI